LEPELKSQIKDWEKKLDPKTAKKLFIREGAKGAYKDSTVKEFTTETLKEVIDLVTASSMTKEEIGMHIANLEEARAMLSALTQGYQIAFAEEKEPIFKARRDKEEKEKRTAKPKTLEDKLSGLGIDLNAFLSAMSKSEKVPEKVGIKEDKPSTPPENPIPAPTVSKIQKFTCEKCGRELALILKNSHKC
jgi:hypothetical protein